MPRDVHAELFNNPDAPVKVDQASQTVTLPDGRAIKFPVCTVDPCNRVWQLPSGVSTPKFTLLADFFWVSILIAA